MGHTQQDKAASRRRIVEATARRIREQGIERPAIAEIMRSAGLTHGGFYKHFSSRDELIAEAVGQAMTDSQQTFRRTVAEADDPLAAIAAAYLSPEHRDDPGTGCGVPALGAEMPHAGAHARGHYDAQVERYLEVLQALEGTPGEEGRRRATVTLSAMVGGLLLARALEAPGASDEVLTTVREAIGDRRLLPDSGPKDDHHESDTR